MFPDFLITRILYFLINSLNWWMGLHCSSVLYTQWKTQKKVMGKILVAGKHLNLGGKWTWRDALHPRGKQDRVVLGVATLDRSPAQSAGGEVHIP